MRQFYGTLGGVETLLYSDSFHYGKLAFGDLNGDGVAEMLVGTEDGRVSRFDNTGTSDAPVWRLVEETMTVGQPERPGQPGLVQRPLRVNGFAAPALVDLDGDGDLDLLVGSADGKVALFRNVGTPLLPSFVLADPDFIPAGLGTKLVPVAMDLNGDRAPDLLIGTAEGEVYLLMNSGTRRDPAFCGRLPAPGSDPDDEPPCLPLPRLAASVKPDIAAAPALADWSGDAKPDLFIGQADGTIAYYENRGTGARPQWTLTQRKFLAIDEGGYAAPAFLPSPGGRPYLYVGSSTNGVSLYSNRDTAATLDAWKVTGNALSIGRFGRVQERLVLTAGDVDGDGDLDLLLGDRSGAVWWIENVGTARAPAWRLHPRPIVPESPRGFSAPLLADIDGDGDLDLLVGGGDGRLWLLRNMGTAKVPNWVMETTAFADIDVGSGSIPAVTDIDGDGDLDLFVGNSRGLVIFYRNEGDAHHPDFRLASTRFGDISVGQAAAPAFFDWNEDKLPDLVIGNREGRLALLVNENAGDTQPRKWKTETLSWEGIQVRGYSVPVFGDFNGDGKPDLLIADGQGNLRLYLNGGLEKPPEAVPGQAGAVAAPGSPSPGAATRGVVSAVAPPVPPRGTPGAPASAEPPGPKPAARPAPQASVGAAAASAVAPSRPGSKASATVPPATGRAPAPESPSSGRAAARPADKALSGGLPGPDKATGADQGTDTGAGRLPPSYELVSEKYAGIQVEGRAVPAFGDLDGDGDLDLVVGTGKGKVLFFRNTGTPQEAKWTAEGGLPLDRPVGRNASVILADLDGDGLLDLLAGSEDGKVAFYRNTGTKERPAFALQEGVLANVNVGRNSAPAVLPLLNDPSGRLVVGNFAGNLFLY
ncbi:MAG: FG-GAP-like repeat-containing protein, partial [SAR324 cluster bacterium]